MHIRWRSYCAVAVLWTSSSIAAAPDASSVHALTHFLAALNSFAANFEQQIKDETGAILESSSGNVEISRPGKFAWFYHKPYRQSIVSNGHTLWLYDEDLAQVTVNAVDTNAAGSAAQLLGDKVDLNAVYTIKSMPPRDGVDWLELKPKKAAAQYQQIEIGMAGENLAKMRLFDNLGQVTELTFSNLQRNPTLDPKHFDFTPPPNVDVISGLNSGAR